MMLKSFRPLIPILLGFIFNILGWSTYFHHPVSSILLIVALLLICGGILWFLINLGKSKR
jgi:protein-S-isoprenylcysteine O-methyltransferase Ste14